MSCSLSRMFALLLISGVITVSATAHSAPADLIGTWYSDDGSFQYIFGEGSTLTVVENAGQENEARFEGSYTATSTTLTMTVEEESPVELTYYVAGGLLSLGALLPQGPHTGVVGIWEGRDAFGRIRIEMRADNTATYTIWDAGSNDPQVFQGTYAETETDLYEVILQDPGGEPIEFSLYLIDNSALGGVPLFDEPPSE